MAIPDKKPILSKTAFGDVNFTHLDYEKNSIFILEKVIIYGLWTDILEVLKYYGLERVKKEIVQIAYFKKPAFAFLCVLLDLKPADFTASQRRQARTSNWD